MSQPDTISIDETSPRDSLPILRLLAQGQKLELLPGSQRKACLEFRGPGWKFWKRGPLPAPLFTPPPKDKPVEEHWDQLQLRPLSAAEASQPTGAWQARWVGGSFNKAKRQVVSAIDNYDKLEERSWTEEQHQRADIEAFRSGKPSGSL